MWGKFLKTPKSDQWLVETMPKIETWLNKQQYKQFKKRAESKHMSEYAYLKSLVLKPQSDV